MYKLPKLKDTTTLWIVNNIHTILHTAFEKWVFLSLFSFENLTAVPRFIGPTLVIIGYIYEQQAKFANTQAFPSLGSTLMIIGTFIWGFLT